MGRLARKGPAFIVPVLAGLMLLLTGCIIRIERPAVQTGSVQTGSVQTGSVQTGSVKSSENSRGPLPAPDTTGLDDYTLHMLFASRYIEEGDYQGAFDEIALARIIRDDDPALFELLAIAYDADRQSEAAFGSFLRAGRMYLDAGRLDKAQRMLGWLRTFPSHYDDPAVADLERQLGSMQADAVPGG